MLVTDSKHAVPSDTSLTRKSELRSATPYKEKEELVMGGVTYGVGLFMAIRVGVLAYGGRVWLTNMAGPSWPIVIT